MGRTSGPDRWAHRPTRATGLAHWSGSLVRSNQDPGHRPGLPTRFTAQAQRPALQAQSTGRVKVIGQPVHPTSRPHRLGPTIQPTDPVHWPGAAQRSGIQKTAKIRQPIGKLWRDSGRCRWTLKQLNPKMGDFLRKSLFFKLFSARQFFRKSFKVKLF